MYFPFPIALGELTRGLATDLTMSHGNPVAGEHPAPADEMSPPGLKKSEFSAYLRGALGQIYADWPCLYNSSKIDVGVLMRTTIAWFLVIAILRAAYAAWPLTGLSRLASAGETRNAARLAARVDFPSLRRSLAEQVIATYLRLTGKDAGLGKFTQGMVIGVTASAVDPIVDRMINAESMIELLSKGSVGAGMSINAAPVTAASLDSVWQTWLDSEYSFRNFYVRLPPHAEPAQRFRLMLRVTAWTWRLTRIDLPESVRILLAQEAIKAKPP